jgi:hypothetical protein
MSYNSSLYSPHLKPETDQVSETMCFLEFRKLDDRQSPETQWFWVLYALVKTQFNTFLAVSYKRVLNVLEDVPSSHCSRVSFYTIDFNNEFPFLSTIYTEQIGWIGNTCGLCSEGGQFRFRPGHEWFWLGFFMFLLSLSKYFELFYSCLIQIHYSVISYHWMLCTLLSNLRKNELKPCLNVFMKSL